MVPQNSPVKRAAFHDFLHRQTSLFGRPRPLIKLRLIPELHFYDSATLIPRRREPPILTKVLSQRNRSVMDSMPSLDLQPSEPGFVGIQFCQEW